jgi:hypothetical protein
VSDHYTARLTQVLSELVDADVTTQDAAQRGAHGKGGGAGDSQGSGGGSRDAVGDAGSGRNEANGGGKRLAGDAANDEGGVGLNGADAHNRDDSAT